MGIAGRLGRPRCGPRRRRSPSCRRAAQPGRRRGGADPGGAPRSRPAVALSAEPDARWVARRAAERLRSGERPQGGSALHPLYLVDPMLVRRRPWSRRRVPRRSRPEECSRSSAPTASASRPSVRSATSAGSPGCVRAASTIPGAGRISPICWRLPGGFGLLARLFERNLAGLDGMRGVGFALSRVMRDEGELLSIGVGPAYRRRAIGAALLRESMDRCPARRCGHDLPRGRDRQPVGPDALPVVRLRRGRRARGLLSAPGRNPGQRLPMSLRPDPAKQRRTRATRLALRAPARGSARRRSLPDRMRSARPPGVSGRSSRTSWPWSRKVRGRLSSGSPSPRRMLASSPAAMFSSESLVLTKVNGQVSAEMSELLSGFRAPRFLALSY